jgi:hypothetical protein
LGLACTPDKRGRCGKERKTNSRTKSFHASTSLIWIARQNSTASLADDRHAAIVNKRLATARGDWISGRLELTRNQLFARNSSTEDEQIDERLCGCGGSALRIGN